MWPDEDELLYNLLDDLPTSHGFEPNTRPWLGQEVIDQGGEPIKKDEYVGMGAVTEFNYCFSLANLQNSLAQLRTVADRPQNWGFLTDKNAFVFVNNHDNQRGHGGGGGIVTFESPQSLKVTTAMMMALPYGTKRIMSSYFFADSDAGPPSGQPSTSDGESGECTNGWVCEHRWPGIKNLGMLSGAMNKEAGYDNWWDNGASQVSFSRGEGFFVVNNDGWELNGGVQTGLPSGVYCNLATGNIDSCGDTIEIDSDGFACINIQAGSSIPFAYTILDARIGDFDEMNECKDLASGPISECYDCSCPSNKKLDCGMMGITAQGCVDKGCAWCPSETPGDPWCFWLAEDAVPPSPTDNPGNGGGTTQAPGGNPGSCPSDLNTHVDCGDMTTNQASCVAKGCLWCPTWDGGPAWCTYPSEGGDGNGNGSENLTCPGPSGRDDCGYMGIDEGGCMRKGCVWCPITSPGPWCTYGVSASTTASTTTTKTTTTKATTTESTTDGGDSTTDATTSSPGSATTSGSGGTTSKPSGGGGSGGCDASVECCQKEEFEQLCPEDVNCNIPDLMDREDCGELASTPTTCVASGCCWQEQPPGPIEGDPEGRWPPWCYHPSA